MPSEYQLYQNYPNPFNPRTTIRRDLPSSTRVTLRIYDLFGREVETLVDEIQEAGFKTVEWNADGYASGIYMCVLRAADVALTRKVALIK